MKKQSQFLVLVLFMACCNIAGQRFSLLQITQVNSETDRLLRAFSSYSAYTPGEVREQEIPEAFLAAFQSDARIYNFLDPGASEQAPVSPADYYQYIRKHYASGLRFTMIWNVKNMSRPVPEDIQHTRFAGYIPVEIKAIGLFDGQKINNISGEYYAVVGFRLIDGQVTDGIIHSIQAEKPLIRYTREKRVCIGPYAAPAFTRIHSRDIFNDEVWDAWGEFGYRAGLKVIFGLSPDFGIFSGAGTSSYRSVYEIRDYDNASLVKSVKTDMDGDDFMEYIRASVTETNTLAFLDIPLGIQYRTGEKKIRMVIRAGLEFSFLLSSRYSVTGFSDHSGYYPEYHVILYDLPDYGFTAGPVDINEKWKLNPFNLSACVSAGAEFSINKNICLAVIPFVNTGLTDLGYETSRHRDDYVSISGNPGKLTTRSAGILFEVYFKL